jgi:Tol biopolymer transport system component
MTMHTKRGVCSLCGLASLVGMLAVLSGCAFFRPGIASVAPEEPLPMLAAARANNVSMFGDVGGRVSPVYSSRAAMSLRQHTFAEVGDDNDADVDSTDGVVRMVFSSTRHNRNPDLYMKSIDGVAVVQLTSDPASDIQPAFSPDGRRVAFASNRGGQWDIWVVNTDGGPALRITDSMADEVHPSWSPDGRQLVFCSLPADGGQWELWIAQAHSGASRKFVGYGLFPEWSPVDDTLLYQRARERGTRKFGIWTLTLVDGEPRYPTELAASAHDAFTLPTWSQDGSRIAFSSVTERPAGSVSGSTQPTTYDIWIMSADGRAKARLTDGHTINFAPVFAPDDRVYFVSNRAGPQNVWSLMPTGVADGQNDVERVTRTPLQSQGGRVMGSGIVGE